MNIEQQELCYFCKTTPKKYTCPRCNVDFCSLTCFQSTVHLRCSENFYQSCVLDTFSLGAGEEAEQKMEEVLRRFHEGNSNESALPDSDSLDSDDDAEGLSLADRLANVDLDDTKEVWKRLNSDERQEFEAFLRSGDVSKFVPKWEPWWTTPVPKITEIDDNYLEQCPKILDDIKDLSSLTNKPPSKCVQYNIVNSISAYAFTVRYFNGDHYDFVDEAVGCITYLSLSFKENRNYENISDALLSVQSQMLKNEWISVDEENIATMKDDVSLIVKGNGNNYVLCALSDLHRLFTTLLNQQSKGSNHFMISCPTYKVSKRDVKLYLKKLMEDIRYHWYQTNTHMVLTVMAANVTEQGSSVLFSAERALISLMLPNCKAYVRTLKLAHDIVPQECSYKIKPDSVEVKLKKAEPIHWEFLEDVPQRVFRYLFESGNGIENQRLDADIINQFFGDVNCKGDGNE